VWLRIPLTSASGTRCEADDKRGTTFRSAHPLRPKASGHCRRDLLVLMIASFGLVRYALPADASAAGAWLNELRRRSAIRPATNLWFSISDN